MLRYLQGGQIVGISPLLADEPCWLLAIASTATIGRGTSRRYERYRPAWARRRWTSRSDRRLTGSLPAGRSLRVTTTAGARRQRRAACSPGDQATSHRRPLRGAGRAALCR